MKFGNNKSRKKIDMCIYLCMHKLFAYYSTYSPCLLFIYLDKCNRSTARHNKTAPNTSSLLLYYIFKAAVTSADTHLSSKYSDKIWLWKNLWWHDSHRRLLGPLLRYVSSLCKHVFQTSIENWAQTSCQMHINPLKSTLTMGRK
jgi:hypothetical protein